MILSDRDIEKAVKDGKIIVKPSLDKSLLSSSSLDLRVGDDFRTWNQGLFQLGTRHNVSLDLVNLATLGDFTTPLTPNADGIIVIEPGQFVLVRTYEHISLPVEGKLAARVEGKSKQARLGMVVHLTAPTVHAGFAGKIVLEIINHGPFQLEVVPNKSKLCQLIFEKVSTKPHRRGSVSFSDQSTPLGSPPPSGRKK